MNEIYARGTTANPDWIEIYNKSNTAIDISGYKIYDAGGESGAKPKKEFPTGSIVSPLGFLVIVTDDTDRKWFWPFFKRRKSVVGKCIFSINRYHHLCRTYCPAILRKNSKWWRLAAFRFNYKKCF